MYYRKLIDKLRKLSVPHSGLCRGTLQVHSGLCRGTLLETEGGLGTKLGREGRLSMEETSPI